MILMGFPDAPSPISYWLAPRPSSFPRMDCRGSTCCPPTIEFLRAGTDDLDGDSSFRSQAFDIGAGACRQTGADLDTIDLGEWILCGKADSTPEFRLCAPGQRKKILPERYAVVCRFSQSFVRMTNTRTAGLSACKLTAVHAENKATNWIKISCLQRSA